MADLLETDLAFMSLILALLNLSGYRAAVGRMPFGNKNLDHVLRQVLKSTNFLRSLALRQPKIARRLVASGKPLTNFVPLAIQATGNAQCHSIRYGTASRSVSLNAAGKQ